MHRNFWILRIFFIGCALFAQTANAMNWLRPYDVTVRPFMHWERPWAVVNWNETAFRPALGFNSCDDKVNVLQIWSCDQNALAMLDGFNADSIIGQARIALDAADDGVRGHLQPTGDFRLLFNTIFGLYYKFCDYFWIAGYVPFMGQRLSNVAWCDLTQSLTPEDARVQDFLTNDFFSNVCDLGNGLDLCDWKRHGLGDITVMLDWYKQYPQRREVLRNVTLNWSVGINFPTGKKADQDKLMALSFGYGTWAVIFSGGLRVLFGDTLCAGLDVRLAHLFGNTRERRIKTAVDQTELLLLAKTPAYKDYGLLQRFTLYMQACHVVRGLSVLAGYQFLKKGQDTLQLETCEFSTAIANTAVSLRQWLMQQVVISVNYDFGHDYPHACVWPQATAFVRLPFNGRRVIVDQTVGVVLSIEF